MCSVLSDIEFKCLVIFPEAQDNSGAHWSSLSLILMTNRAGTLCDVDGCRKFCLHGDVALLQLKMAVNR